MNEPRYPDGTLIITARGKLGRIHKSGNIVPGAFGYWVNDQTGDPGQDWGHPTFAQHVTPAVIGETVCPNPRFPTCVCQCWCGLAHVTRPQMVWLPVKGDEPWRRAGG